MLINKNELQLLFLIVINQKKKIPEQFNAMTIFIVTNGFQYFPEWQIIARASPLAEPFNHTDVSYFFSPLLGCVQIGPG